MVKPGWVETTIGALVDNKQISIQTGPFGTVLSASEYVDHGIPVISVREIRQGYIQLFDETPAVSDLTYRKMPQFALKSYDLVFARKGSVDRSALIPENSQKLFLGSDGIRLRFSDPILAQIVFHCVQRPQTRQFLTVSAYGTTMAGLNETIISSIPIYIPCDSKEQQRIAEALSDVDELIASLEKQIEKKKAIKQGAMQELLTGKRRLPGFSGEWKSVCLSEIGYFIKGSGISRADANSGKLPAVRYGELYTKHTDYVKRYYSHISRDVAATATPVTYGAILFAASGETKEEIGKCTAIIDNRTAYVGGDILIFIPERKVHPVFLGTLLNTPEICKQKAQRGQGDAIVHIHADSLSQIKVQIPNYDEQAAIADMLLSTDRDIDLLEMKLAKARQVKQGMMQQLLTGNTRLLY